MEIDLEGFDTVKLVKLLRQSGEFQTVQIIGMGSDLEDARIQQLYRIGFNAFLLKPFLVEELTELFAVTAAEDLPRVSSGPAENNNT